MTPKVVGNYKITQDSTGAYRVMEAGGACRMLAKRFKTEAAAEKRAQAMTRQDEAR